MTSVLDRRPALFIASRMKRLAERMQMETMALLEREHLPIQPSNVLLLATLQDEGPRSIGDLAASLRVAQPTVTRAVSILASLGIVDVSRDSKDRRVQIVALTEAGRDMWGRAETVVWASLETAVEELVAELDGPFLPMLLRLERLLDESPIDERARRSRATLGAER